ncbi:heat-inducible transcriptional repressor HrcA [Chloroflexota bacterium]
MLSTRSEAILRSIIEQYIDQATPISSQSIFSKRRLGVSPATIRNEIALLEDEGYVSRPHTSAGSVPTDRGYRQYVSLLHNIELPPAEQRLIRHLFHQIERELEEWLRLAATLVAQLVQNMAVVSIPKTASCRFKYLEMVALQDVLALVVLVLRGARVKQQLITFDQPISQAELTTIGNKLNTVYTDLSGDEILSKEIDCTPVEQQIIDCITKMMQTEDNQEYEEPRLNGLHFMLSQPEFANSQRTPSLLELIDQGSLLNIIAPKGLSTDEVQVVIGKENKAEVIQDYSIVISRYGLSNEAAGAIGVIGPTRMPYARAISTVNYLSRVLSGLSSELYGEDQSVS